MKAIHVIESADPISAAIVGEFDLYEDRKAVEFARSHATANPGCRVSVFGPSGEPQTLAIWHCSNGEDAKRLDWWNL